MTRLCTTRTSVRLDHETLRLIDSKRLEGQTRTDIITEALFWLKRRLFFSMIPEEDLATLTKQSRGDGLETIQIRLKDHLREFYKFNLYNITTCIKYAIRHYDEP